MMYAHARASGDGTLIAQHVCRPVSQAEDRCSKDTQADLNRAVQHYEAMG